MWFFLIGGFPMWLVTFFGALALFNAGRYAWAPSPGRLPHTVALGVVVALSGVLGVATDLMTVALQVPQNEEWARSPEVAMIVLTGVGESLAPAVLASGLLVAQALLVALGLRRGEGV